MNNSHIFDYANVMNKALDGAWLRNEALANNISNATTPGYKRQDVDFESQLKLALGNNRYEAMDFRVGRLRMNELEPTTFADYAGYSYRLDGNNVDIDSENAQLASNQLKYNGLMLSMNQEFANLKLVIK